LECIIFTLLKRIVFLTLIAVSSAHAAPITEDEIDEAMFTVYYLALEGRKTHN
jgi:hypothetical protein